MAVTTREAILIREKHGQPGHSRHLRQNGIRVGDMMEDAELADRVKAVSGEGKRVPGGFFDRAGRDPAASLSDVDQARTGSTPRTCTPSCVLRKCSTPRPVPVPNVEHPVIAERVDEGRDVPEREGMLIISLDEVAVIGLSSREVELVLELARRGAHPGAS